MAAGSTTYTFEVTLSDLTRDVYKTLTVRIARHSSEVSESTICKLLAYCLEYDDALELSKGLDDPEMPALWARDLTGALTTWIEVGSPSAEKLHKASKKVTCVKIYTYKNPETVLQLLSKEKIHRSELINLFSFAHGFLTELASTLEKRNRWSITISDDSLYIEIAAKSFASEVVQHSL